MPNPYPCFKIGKIRSKNIRNFVNNTPEWLLLPNGNSPSVNDGRIATYTK